jgi:hypothetical protein
MALGWRTELLVDIGDRVGLMVRSVHGRPAAGTVERSPTLD